MEITKQSDLVEVRALKPFCGSYKCELGVADIIEDETVEVNGVITKTKVARKRFAGLIAVERTPTEHEANAIKAEAKPPHIEVLASDKSGVTLVRVHPIPSTAFVPQDIAASLVERGLAEAVVKQKRGRA
jgi:hypothetical protein